MANCCSVAQWYCDQSISLFPGFCFLSFSSRESFSHERAHRSAPDKIIIYYFLVLPPGSLLNAMNSCQGILKIHTLPHPPSVSSFLSRQYWPYQLWIYRRDTWQLPWWVRFIFLVLGNCLYPHFSPLIPRIPTVQWCRATLIWCQFLSRSLIGQSSGMEYPIRVKR